MRGLVITLLSVAAVLLMVLLVIGCYKAMRTFRRRRGDKSLAEAMRETPWEYYSRYDPASHRWVIGVERVKDTLVLNRVEMFTFPPEQGDSAEVAEAEGEAMLQAGTFNKNRTGM